MSAHANNVARANRRAAAGNIRPAANRIVARQNGTDPTSAAESTGGGGETSQAPTEPTSSAPQREYLPPVS